MRQTIERKQARLASSALFPYSKVHVNNSLQLRRLSLAWGVPPFVLFGGLDDGPEQEDSLVYRLVYLLIFE